MHRLPAGEASDTARALSRKADGIPASHMSATATLRSFGMRLASGGQQHSHSCLHLDPRHAARSALRTAATSSVALCREEGGEARDTERGPLLRSGRDSSAQRNGHSQEARQRELKAGKAMPELTLPQCLVCAAPAQTPECIMRLLMHALGIAHAWGCSLQANLWIEPCDVKTF